MLSKNTWFYVKKDGGNEDFIRMLNVDGRYKVLFILCIMCLLLWCNFIMLFFVRFGQGLLRRILV